MNPRNSRNSTSPTNIDDRTNSTNQQLGDRSFWIGKRVVVTGGAGFLGSYVVEKLQARGCQDIFIPRSADYDLRLQQHVTRMYEDAKPNIVIHLAAVVGGIGANLNHPGQFFYENAAMGIHLIEEARNMGVQKFVCVGTICAYPKFTPVPFSEDDLWNGYPEETNAPYGIAKKALLVQLQAYRQEYGFNGIYLLPVNLYGPGDNFDPAFSHVIPAVIKKFVDAKRCGETKVTVWGTGDATREFLFADDAAEGIILATEGYDKAAPVNLGTGIETTIKEVVRLIKKLVGYQGEIEWDTSKPDGQPRRCLDTRRARQEFGFEARKSLEEGLRETVSWYEERYLL